MAASLNSKIESTKYKVNLKQLLWTYYSGLKYIQSAAELITVKLHGSACIRTAELICSEAAVGYADL